MGHTCMSYIIPSTEPHFKFFWTIWCIVGWLARGLVSPVFATHLQLFREQLPSYLTLICLIAADAEIVLFWKNCWIIQILLVHFGQFSRIKFTILYLHLHCKIAMAAKSGTEKFFLLQLWLNVSLVKTANEGTVRLQPKSNYELFMIIQKC